MELQPRMEMSLRVVSKKRSKNSHSIISNERIVYVSSNGYASFSLPLFVDIMGCCHSTPYMLGQQSQKKRREGARKTSSLSHAISEDKECMGNDSFQTLEEILGLEDFGKTHWASCNNSHKNDKIVQKVTQVRKKNMYHLQQP